MCPDTAQGLGGGPRAPKSAGERPKMLESAREWPESGPRAPESARSNQLLICHMHAYIYIYVSPFSRFGSGRGFWFVKGGV